MNIDERLEKLVERHEALAQTMELLTAMHRENEERYEKRFAQNEERAAQMMDAINRLAHIADIHERRLDDLEG